MLRRGKEGNKKMKDELAESIVIVPIDADMDGNENLKITCTSRLETLKLKKDQSLTQVEKLLSNRKLEGE